MSENTAYKPQLVYLRDLGLADINPLMEIANNKAIADNMITLPYPLAKEDAIALINESNGSNFVKGIIENQEEKLVGIIKLRDLDKTHEQIELSIWINPTWWGKGYGSSAVRLMLKMAFETSKINRVYAHCMVNNDNSRRIMQKAGMIHEGTLRQRVKKNNEFIDVMIWAILKQDWKAIGG